MAASSSCFKPDTGHRADFSPPNAKVRPSSGNQTASAPIDAETEFQALSHIPGIELGLRSSSDRGLYKATMTNAKAAARAQTKPLMVTEAATPPTGALSLALAFGPSPVGKI